MLAPTKEAMIGLFQGFKVQTNFPDVIKCLEDVYGLAKGIAGAVADFAAKNYAKGLADLTSILAQLPSAISDCKNAKDGEMILRALEIIKHPLSVEYE